MNPFLSVSSLPYQLPDFSAISLSHVEPAIEEGIAQDKESIAQICAAEPSWENTIEALERTGVVINRAAAWLFNMQAVDTNEDIDAVATRVVQRLSAHSDEIYQNADLFQRVQKVNVPDNDEARALHKEYVSRFTRRGAGLSAAEQAELRDINAELASLAEEFGQNLLQDTRQLALAVEHEAKLDGLHDIPQDLTVHLELPATQSALSQLTDRQTRRELMDASRARGRESNAEIVVQMINLRAQRAQLLGFDTHADFVIDQETAPDVASVRNLLHDLAPAAAANALAEHKLASEEAGFEVTDADWPYYAAQRASVSDEELYPYFEAEKVLVDGVFYAAHLAYGISVRPRNDVQAYRDDVGVWEVLDADGTGLGLLLTDFQARPSKRGGAWMSSFVDQSHLLDQQAVVVNVMSLGGKYLTVDEVRTMFHEFGHGLHGLLSNVRYPSLSGTSVPRDWVEFPSQLNENFALHPDVLSHYAVHRETGEVIPDELVQAIKHREQDGQGFATAEYLAAAIIDLAMHSVAPGEVHTFDDVLALCSEALAVLDVPHLVPRYEPTYFNHIFAGGYSAGYYSYLWAEALDADGWAEFEKGLQNAGKRYRDTVLSRGATRDHSSAYEQFRGRAVTVDALLARRGLAGVEL